MSLFHVIFCQGGTYVRLLSIIIYLQYLSAAYRYAYAYQYYLVPQILPSVCFVCKQLIAVIV